MWYKKNLITHRETTMGPDSTDLAFIVIGSIMAIVGCVLYFAMQIWTNLRDADALLPTSVSLAISFGISVAINGLIVGYGIRMSLAAITVLTAIMLMSFVWTCLDMRNLYKLTYGKAKRV